MRRSQSGDPSRPTKRQTHEERQELARLEQAVLTAYATLTEFYAAGRIKPDAGGVQPAAAARRRR